MATDFKYCDISTLTRYVNRIADFDKKFQLFNPSTSSNLHTFQDTGYVDVLFINGEEQATANTDTPNANNEWWYISATNKVEYYNDGYSSTTINEQIFEAGEDFTTYLNQELVNASLELHNYIDGRYPTPLEKNKQIDTTTTHRGVVGEYDPIIIKAVSYICASNVIRAKAPEDEMANFYMNLVTNAEGTGLVDMLNAGRYKLSFEADANDKKGSIRYRSLQGTMDIVELGGQYYGEHFDLLKVEVETTGVYGTSEFKVHYFGDDKLYGSTSSAEKITGGLQHIHNGLYGRFQGNSATDGDLWEIEVFGSHREVTNKSSKSIELIR
tara:strand:+ start:640 stop:1617 length:978 start_codon:yes stop_codon:yes gene_type:complete